MSNNNNINQLESDSILSLLVRYSVPAIIGTTASSLYNIIDRVFIGQGVGPLAISGLALTFPLMNLSVAFSTLVSVGAGTVISIRLGERKKEEAAKILGNALILNIIIGFLLSVFMFVFLDKILFAFGASEATLPYAKEFMQIILCGNIITHIYFGLNNIMRASGYPRKSMIIMLITVGLNLVLAPVFIFAFDWGIKGAALATVISQCVGMIQVLSHFLRRTSTIYFIKDCFKLDLKIIKAIFSIGMSPFLMHVCASMVAIIMNVSLKQYGGDMAVGAYGIINSVLGLFAMVIVGMNQGMQPIVGYNYGAKIYSRVLQAYKYTVAGATLVTILGFLISQLFPEQIAFLFTKDEELLLLTEKGLRITMLVYPVVGFQMVTSNFFQAIGKASISVFMTLSRQVVFLIPALIILPLFFDLEGVWYASPVSDFTAFLLTAVILHFQLKKLRFT